MTTPCHSPVTASPLGWDGSTHSLKESWVPESSAHAHPRPAPMLLDSLGSPKAQLQGRLQSDAPASCVRPACWNSSLFGKQFGPSDAEDGSLPTAPLCQAWAAGQSLLPFYPGLGSDQTGTTRPPGSHVAQENVSGKLMPTPQDIPQSLWGEALTAAWKPGVVWFLVTERKPLNTPKGSVSDFSGIGETLPLETLPEARLDLNSWNLMEIKISL